MYIVYVHVAHMKGFIGVRYEGDEHTKNHIDEQGYENVEVYFGENEGRHRQVIHQNVGVEHVVPVDE